MSTPASLLFACGVIAAVSIPLILRIVPPNRLYGFRTPQTLADRRLWFRANHFAGWALLIAAVTSAALLGFAPEGARSISAYEVAAFVVPLVIALVASFAYLRKARRNVTNK